MSVFLIMKIDPEKIVNGQKYLMKGFNVNPPKTNFRFLSLVSKENILFAYSIGYICSCYKEDLVKFIKPEEVGLTSKQFDKQLSKFNDFILYSLDKLNYLVEPVQLKIPVRGLRYNKEEEEYFLKFYFFKCLCKGKPITWQNDYYETLYYIAMQENMVDVFFDYSLNEGIYKKKD